MLARKGDKNEKVKSVKKALSCLVVVGILMSAVPAVVAEGASDRSNEIPDDYSSSDRVSRGYVATLGGETEEEDPFNYQGKCVIDETKLNPDEKKALPHVQKYAKEQKVSPALLMAIIKKESSFNPNAIGDGGLAIGYMQLHWDAAYDAGYRSARGGATEDEKKTYAREDWPTDGLDPDTNIKYGCGYLKIVYNQWGSSSVYDDSLKNAISAYNLGRTHGPDRSNENSYVNPVLGYYEEYKGKYIASSTGYNREAAYNYARKYWDEVCSDGYFWWGENYGEWDQLPLGTNIEHRLGNDCAHFVSCCIGSEPNEQGGGLGVPSRVSPTYGEPSAGKLGDWLLSSGLAEQKTSIDQLEKGDVINYDWKGDGHWNHVALYLGNGKVAAHTTCVESEPWQLGTTHHRLIHIKTAYSLDLIFAIDTTGSMWDDIDEAKASASSIVDEVLSDIPGARIAVVDYKDFPVSPYGDPGDYEFNDVLSFSTDKPTIVAAIQGLTVGGGNDWEESVYSALMHSIDSTSLGSWRGSDQAAKVIILMGDAPPHDPEPFTGYTLSSVSTAAELADPVIIYPIQIGGTVEKFEELADQTGGKAFTAENAGEVVDAILEALEEIKTKPIAYANGPYLGYVGCPITFDGTGSYDIDGTIVSYEWDLDDDGEFDDATGATPSKTWNTVYSGNIGLKVTDNDGNEDVDGTTVTVRDLVSITTATGTGTAYFASDAGTIEDLTALKESDLPEENSDLDFPHGLFEFNITGLTPGETVTVSIDFPQNIPTTAQYWKYHTPQGWYQLPTMGSNDGDNIITIQLTDGGIGDDDGVANGVIVDQGGPGLPKGKADLTLSPADISFSPASQPTEGDSVTITATVHNIGAADATNFVVSFFDGVVLIGTETISVTASSSSQASTTWTATPAGEHTIKVVADSGGAVAESNEANNEASKKITVSAPLPVPEFNAAGLLAFIGVLSLVLATAVLKRRR